VPCRWVQAVISIHNFKKMHGNCMCINRGKKPSLNCCIAHTALHIVWQYSVHNTVQTATVTLTFLLPEEAKSILLHPWSCLWQWQPNNLRHPKERHKKCTLQVADRLVTFHGIWKKGHWCTFDSYVNWSGWTGSCDISKGSLRVAVQ